MIIAVKDELMQLQKESLRKFSLVGIQTLTSAIPVQCSNRAITVS